MDCSPVARFPAAKPVLADCPIRMHALSTTPSVLLALLGLLADTDAEFLEAEALRETAE